MAFFGNKMMVFEEGSIYASSLILYQTFKNTVADLTGLNVPTTSGTSYVNGLYSGLPNESIAIPYFPNSGGVSTPNHTRFSFESKASFSIAIAFKLDDISSYRFILQKNGSDGYTNAEYYINAINGALRIRLIDSTSLGYIDYNLGSVAVGVNYVLVISYDSVNEITCKINNVDRTATKTTTGTFNSMQHGTAPLELYKNFWRPTLKAYGTVDTLAMFNKELTSAEKTDIYTKITTNQSLL